MAEGFEFSTLQMVSAFVQILDCLAVAHTQCIANVVSQHEVSVRSKGVCRGFLQIPPRDELTCLGP